MNKQLEEPIAVERIHVITPEIFGDVVRADDYDALLQRSERLDAMLTESVEALEASEQTLEREREKSRRVMSENQQQAHRIAELEAKLATPVLLPDVLIISVSRSPVPVMHAERVKERIRAAGFKCEGEA